METKEIFNIKKNGHLVALSDCWQYWLLNDIVYAVNVEGTHYSFWCGVSGLARHLVHLYKVLGYRFFTENDSMTIIDKSFFKQFIFA